MLVKKLKNEEIVEKINAKINVPQTPSNPRGDSQSINPRMKKLFEFKEEDKTNESIREQEPRNLSQVPEYKIKENHFIKPPMPRRKIYCYSSEREGRAVSTGCSGIRTSIIPKEPVQAKPSNRRNFRPAHVRTPISYNETGNSLNISIKHPSPRAGTAIDITSRKHDLRYLNLK